MTKYDFLVPIGYIGLMTLCIFVIFYLFGFIEPSKFTLYTENGSYQIDELIKVDDNCILIEYSAFPLYCGKYYLKENE